MLLGLYCLVVNVYLLVSSLQELALGMLNVSDYKIYTYRCNIPISMKRIKKNIIKRDRIKRYTNVSIDVFGCLPVKKAAIVKEKKVRKKIVTIVILTVAIVLTMFIAISSVRYGEKYRKNSQNEAVVDETNSPLLYSLLDYFSLWEENSMIVMQDYKPEYKRYGMYNSCSYLSDFG